MHFEFICLSGWSLLIKMLQTNTDLNSHKPDGLTMVIRVNTCTCACGH